MTFKFFTLATALFATAFTAQAGEVYVGAGFPGLTLGYAHAWSPSVKLRGEYAGGLSLNKNGKTGGVDYNAQVKTGRAGAFADWFPTDTGFHLTGGVTANDIGGTFVAQGGTQTINGKSVDLTDKSLTIRVKYPDVAPYLGLGWSSKPGNAKGWGAYADLGLQMGKFKTSYTESGVIGAGITREDLDAEVNEVRDSVNKLSVLPSLSLGVTYRF